MSKRKPGRNKRAWVRKRLQHVRERADIRYGLVLTNDDIRALQKELLAFCTSRGTKTGLFVGEVAQPTDERPYSIYVVLCKDTWIPIIFERARGIVHTVLPEEDLP